MLLCHQDDQKVRWITENLLQLLLGTKLVGVPALLLPAVQGTRVEASIADPADHLVAVVLGGEQAEGGLDHAAAQPQHQVEGAEPTEPLNK